MKGVSRRALLTGGPAIGVAALVPTLAPAQSAPPPPAADSPAASSATAQAVYRFFTSTEVRFIEAAVDRLIPPDPIWPGAKASGVPIYIDRQLIGGYGQGERMYLAGPWQAGMPGQGYQLRLTPAELYRTALAGVAALEAGGLVLADRPPEEQDAFLSSLEAGEHDLGGVPSAVFFETLLANTIEGYFADPAYGGNRDKAGWRMIGFPGAQAAYLGLYTQHGRKFDREPLGMDESVHHHP